MTRTAAVVGGGIGGLTVAAGLHRAGWDVTVFERAAGQPVTGTGLGIWPSAVKALDRIGLGERAREAGRRQPSGTIRRPDGSRIAGIDTDRVQRRHGEPVYLLSRPALLGLLAAALPDGVVRYHTPIDDIAELRAGHDVVIGADGINSRVRRAAFGTAAVPRYAGAITWRGTVDHDVEAGSETWGRGMRFGLTPQEPGRTNWYAAVAAPENHEPDDDLAELRRHFAGWHDPIPAVLDRIDPGTLLRHGLYHLPALPSFVSGKVALLGDAAHAMTPDLGQGACQAMIDGVALAEALTGGVDVATALRRYDHDRRRPAQRIAAASLRVNRLSRMRRFLPVRDAVVRTAVALS